MSFIPELDGHTPEELQAAFEGDPCALLGLPPQDRDLALMEIACRIARRGESGLEFLLPRLPDANPDKARAILMGLRFVPPATLAQRRQQFRGIFFAHLNDRRSLVVAEAIDNLRDLGFSDARTEVAALLKHESPHVAASALRFLSRHDSERAKPLLMEALRSPDAVIRKNAVAELDELAYVEALPSIRGLLADGDAGVRQAAEWAVRNLQDLAARPT